MIKILFFIDTLTGGGAEKVLQTLVNNLDQQQFQITVQTVAYTDPSDYLVPGIRYKAINCCKTPAGRKLFSYWLRLCAELKWVYPLYIRDDYDIEVAYLECGPTKFLSGSTNRDALKLAWVHCDMEKRGIYPSKKLSEVYRSYDKIVCVSERARDSFRHLFGDHPESIVLHNVNDESLILSKANAFVPARSDDFTFISVGRLSYEKGMDRLLNACRTLKDSGSCFRLRILGDGPERSSLESQIQSLGLQDTVELLGFCENPYPYLKAADCVVCASRYEGFSTVVTESLILGKPVITTPCSGMDELLGSSEYGLITEDSTDGIYRGMKAMLDNPAMIRSYANAAALRGQVFSKSSILSETQQFMIEELKKKHN